MASNRGATPEWLRKAPTEDRLVSVVRAILAASALAITLLDPAEPSRFVGSAYTALGLYTLYSLALLWGIFQGRRWAAAILPWCHWLDVFAYSLLVGLSNGSSSIFFFGLFFPILVASFRQGYGAGIAVTAASTLLFAAVGYAGASAQAEFQWNRFLLRTTYLLLLGYAIAYWGGLEIRMKRRLALLSAIAAPSDSRLGAERVLDGLLRRLGEFYAARRCLLAIRDTGGAYTLLRTDPEKDRTTSEPIDRELGAALTKIPENLAVAYRPGRAWPPLRRRYRALDVHTAGEQRHGERETRMVAGALGGDAMLSAPLKYGSWSGRFFILSEKHFFGLSDAAFLVQIIHHAGPLLEHVELVDRLAVSAAEEERGRIARDIHDSLIQPYFGLQMGLSAIREKLRSGGDALGGVEELLATVDSAIQDLRRYVNELRSPATRSDTLHEALKRFSKRFGELTSIEVDVHIQTGLSIGDRLAAETFQMVVEGLSNVRRHTQAQRAVVRLTRRDGQLRLLISNPSDKPPRPFSPRSLRERAEALGGRVSVSIDADSQTQVKIEIPIEIEAKDG